MKVLFVVKSASVETPAVVGDQARVHGSGEHARKRIGSETRKRVREHSVVPPNGSAVVAPGACDSGLSEVGTPRRLFRQGRRGSVVSRDWSRATRLGTRHDRTAHAKRVAVAFRAKSISGSCGCQPQAKRQAGSLNAGRLRSQVYSQPEASQPGVLVDKSLQARGQDAPAAVAPPSWVDLLDRAQAASLASNVVLTRVPLRPPGHGGPLSPASKKPICGWFLTATSPRRRVLAARPRL